MLLLKGQHGSQAHRVGARATDVDTKALGLLDELVAARVVKGNECALALTTEVLELAWVLGGQGRELAVQVVTNAGSLRDEVVLLNLLDDGAEENGARWVTHPRVELAVGLVGPQLGVAKVVASGLGLLGEGHHVGRRGQVPVVMGPELAGGADARLHLVDDQQHTVLLGDLAQAAEEGGRGVVVASLGLDGLNNDGARGDAVVEDQILDLGKGGLLGLLVLLNVFLQRVLEQREGGLGPVECGDVQLVDRLGAGGGERAEQAAVEGGLEGHDGELLRGAGRLVVHG